VDFQLEMPLTMFNMASVIIHSVIVLFAIGRICAKSVAKRNGTCIVGLLYNVEAPT